MPPLSSFLPSLPWNALEIILNVLAGLGAVMVTYAIFLEAERKQDTVLAIGSACLLIYALWIGNMIFTVAMAGIFLASFVELIEILMGRHPHGDSLVEEYRHPEGGKNK